MAAPAVLKHMHMLHKPSCHCHQCHPIVPTQQATNHTPLPPPCILDPADAHQWCPVPGGGADALLFGALAVFVGCALYSRLSAVWTLLAGEDVALFVCVCVCAAATAAVFSCVCSVQREARTLCGTGLR